MSIESQIDEAEKGVLSLIDSLTAVKKSLDEAGKTMTKTVAAFKQFEKDKQAAAAEIADMDRRNEEAKSLNSFIEIKNSEKAKLDHEVAKAKDELARLNDERQARQEEIHGQQKAIEGYEATLNKLKADVDQIKAEKAALLEKFR